MEGPRQNNHLPTVSSAVSVWSLGLPLGSHQVLVRPSSKLSQGSTRKRLEFALAIAILLGIILFAALCITIYFLASPAKVEFCLSQECLKSASNLLDSMDMTVDPCDNFYKYACGRWKREHFLRGSYTMNDWFLERSWLSERDVAEFLLKNDSEAEPLPVHQARALYRSCLDLDSMEGIGLKRLWTLLENIGIPLSPPLQTKPKQSWVVSLAKAKRILSMDFLIGFGIISLPTNKTINKLAIASADDLMLPSRSLKEQEVDKKLRMALDKGEEDVIKIWKKYAVKILSYFLQARNESITDKNGKLNQAAEDLINFQKNISEIEKHENITGPLLNEVPEEITVRELQQLVDAEAGNSYSKIKWKLYFDTVYEGIPGIKLDLEGRDTILAYKKQYFQMLSKYLETVDDYVIELALWWNIIFNLANHINEEVSDLKQTLNGKVLYDMSSQTRTSMCSETSYKLMTFAVSYQVTSQEHIERKKKKVHEMLGNIQNKFKSLVKDLTWMDLETKQLTLEKVDAVRKFIAFPDWMKDHREMNEYYANVTIDEKTHLANILSLLQEGSKAYLSYLRKPHNSSFAEFEPLDINAYYYSVDNSITIPSGILQYPFYDLGLEALNYGSIGVILGHELTHGFDNNGRKYDKEGNMNQWWTNASIEEYNKRTECYVEEYNSYYLPSINRSVDGNLTLAENLADNGGLRESYLAYKDLMDREPKLPGLQNFTQEQLFYLAFGNIWCSEYTSESLEMSLEDEHSPNFVRVAVSLQNSREFAQAWNCPEGSPMNPKHKCKLWVD